MYDLDKSIDFLKERALQLNQRLFFSKTRFERARHSCSQINLEIQKQEMQKIIACQKAISNIIFTLINIAKVNKPYYDRCLNYKKFINDLIEDSIEQKSYNSQHPFYGYTPYKEMLMQRLLEKEDYESCHQLQRENTMK